MKKQSKMPDPVKLSTGKMKERSMEDTMITRPMISVLMLFPLPHQIGVLFINRKDVSDFILQYEDLIMDWLDKPHIKKVLLYYDKIIGKYVKTLGIYIHSSNWEGFVRELKSL